MTGSLAMTRSGIIPAYAGSTQNVVSGRRVLWDHPRIRGEHIIGSIGMVIGWGSSPHTRGAPHGPGPQGTYQRIIPAYAGSTCRTPSLSSPAADHPRIRGEH